MAKERRSSRPPKDEVSGRAIDPRLIRRLLLYARPHWKGFAITSCLLLITAALTIAVPRILGYGIDSYLKPGPDSALSADERSRGVLFVGGIVLSLGVLVFLLRMTQIRITNLTGQRVIHDLRMAVFSHITRRSLRFFDRNPVGSLVTRVTSDIETLNEFFVSGVDVLLGDLVRIFAIVIVLFAIDWRMALVTMAVVPLILGWAFVFQRQARRLFRDVRANVSDLNAYTNESLTGVRIVQTFRREQAIIDNFKHKDKELRHAHVATVKNFSWFFPGMEFLAALGPALIILTGYRLVVDDDLALGELYAFLLYLALFIEPLRQVADKYNIFQSAVASGERVFRVLDDQTALPLPEAPRQLSAVSGEVVFENVSFTYDGRKEVLKGISFRVPHGQHFALVGHTGSGKSTIVNLLSRFYDPQDGRILLDGVDLRELDPYLLRRRIGVVLQDVFLFEGTVRENLNLGNAEIGDALLWESARTVQADGIIRRLGGLDGRIYERGATLSTGEKQLLSFARTLAFDPALLVLDEATAHIDTMTERILQGALRELMNGRSAILIAHRLSTIQSCHKILVMHKGELREQGTHDELLKTNGIYAHLYRLQFD